MDTPHVTYGSPVNYTKTANLSFQNGQSQKKAVLEQNISSENSGKKAYTVSISTEAYNRSESRFETKLRNEEASFEIRQKSESNSKMRELAVEKNRFQEEQASDRRQFEEKQRLERISFQAEQQQKS